MNNNRTPLTCSVGVGQLGAHGSGIPLTEGSPDISLIYCGSE